MAALTTSGMPVFGTTTFITADGQLVFRIGSTTNGLTANGEHVFGLPAVAAGFQPAWAARANVLIGGGAMLR